MLRMMSRWKALEAYRFRRHFYYATSGIRGRPDAPPESVPDDRRRSAERLSPLGLLAQLCLEHFAGGVLRQRFGPYDQVLRYLEVGEVPGREGDQLVRLHGVSGARHDDGADLFSHHRIGDTQDGDLRDGEMSAERILHLDGVGTADPRGQLFPLRARRALRSTSRRTRGQVDRCRQAGETAAARHGHGPFIRLQRIPAPVAAGPTG